MTGLSGTARVHWKWLLFLVSGKRDRSIQELNEVELLLPEFLNLRELVLAFVSDSSVDSLGIWLMSSLSSIWFLSSSSGL